MWSQVFRMLHMKPGHSCRNIISPGNSSRGFEVLSLIFLGLHCLLPQELCLVHTLWCVVGFFPGSPCIRQYWEAYNTFLFLQPVYVDFVQQQCAYTSYKMNTAYMLSQIWFAHLVYTQWNRGLLLVHPWERHILSRSFTSASLQIFSATFVGTSSWFSATQPVMVNSLVIGGEENNALKCLSFCF